MQVIKIAQKDYITKQGDIQKLHQSYEVFDAIQWVEDIKKDPHKLNSLFKSADNSALGISGMNAVTMLAMADDKMTTQLLLPILKMHIAQFEKEHPSGVLILSADFKLQYKETTDLKQIIN